MLNAIFVGIRFVILVLSGHRHVALENTALRQQLVVFKRDIKRPRLHRRDRLFWIGLRTIWTNWKSALVIVRPETVISWCGFSESFTQGFSQSFTHPRSVYRVFLTQFKHPWQA